MGKKLRAKCLLGLSKPNSKFFVRVGNTLPVRTALSARVASSGRPGGWAPVSHRMLGAGMGVACGDGGGQFGDEEVVFLSVQVAWWHSFLFSARDLSPLCRMF